MRRPDLLPHINVGVPVRTGFDSVNPGMPPAMRLGPTIPAQLPAGYSCGTPGCCGDHRSKYEVCPSD